MSWMSDSAVVPHADRVTACFTCSVPPHSAKARDGELLREEAGGNLFVGYGGYVARNFVVELRLDLLLVQQIARAPL